MGSLGGWEIVIILGVLVLLFGAKKLPDMARSVGQSARVFKGEMKGLRDDDKSGDPAPKAEQAPPAPLPTVQPPVQTPPAATQASPEPGARNAGQ